MYATEYNGGNWHNSAVLFQVRAGDGGYVTEAKIADVDSGFKFVVRDAGILWTTSGKVFMAYYQEGSKRHEDPNGADYMGKPMLVGYDVATNLFEFFNEAEDAFGASVTITQTDTTNIYLGGSIDISRRPAKFSGQERWRLLFTKFAEDGNSV